MKTNSDSENLEDSIDLLINKFKETNDPNYLKEASEAVLKSDNPEKKEISILLSGMYFHQIGKKEKDINTSIQYLEVAVDKFKECVGDDIQTKRVELELLKKRRLSHESNTTKNPKFISLTKEIAEKYKELGQLGEYHTEMALHYLFSLSNSEIYSEDFVKKRRLMSKHAEQSPYEDIKNKVKALDHQFEANKKPGFEHSKEQLSKALDAIKNTSDQFGVEELELRLAFAEAMSIGSTRKRKEKLAEIEAGWKKLGNLTEAIRIKDLISEKPVKIDVALDLLEKVIEEHQKFNKIIHEKREIKPGTYKIFYHHSYLIGRINDIKVILNRLGKNRQELRNLAIKKEKFTPKKYKTKKFSKKLQEIFSRSSNLTHQMQYDLESLYIFGNLALDQWAYLIGHIFDIRTREFDFHNLYEEIAKKKKPNQEIADALEKHKANIIWLYFQVRFFRNIFIEHLRDPWQRGNTMSVYGDEFNLFIPSPPGWLPEEEKRDLLQSIQDYMPDYLKKAPDDYWEKANPRRVLEIIYHRIDSIPEHKDREKIWDVWRKVGGSTPSYDLIAFRLVYFLHESVKTINEYISENSESIRLGETLTQETNE